MQLQCAVLRQGCSCCCCPTTQHSINTVLLPLCLLAAANVLHACAPTQNDETEHQAHSVHARTPVLKHRHLIILLLSFAAAVAAATAAVAQRELAADAARSQTSGSCAAGVDDRLLSAVRTTAAN